MSHIDKLKTFSLFVNVLRAEGIKMTMVKIHFVMFFTSSRFSMFILCCFCCFGARYISNVVKTHTMSVWIVEARIEKKWATMELSIMNVRHILGCRDIVVASSIVKMCRNYFLTRISIQIFVWWLSFIPPIFAPSFCFAHSSTPRTNREKYKFFPHKTHYKHKNIYR